MYHKTKNKPVVKTLGHIRVKDFQQKYGFLTLGMTNEITANDFK